jgi:hypothetical protein
MTYDPSIKRWKLEAVFGFVGTNLKLETIKNAAGRFQTAIFETDEKGRLRDLGIKFSKYHLSEEDATKSHEEIKSSLIALQQMTHYSIQEVYDAIEKTKVIDNHDGPRVFNFVVVPPGNAIVGHDINVEENERG